MNELIKKHFSDDEIDDLKYHLEQYKEDRKEYGLASWYYMNVIERFLKIVKESK